MLVAVERVGGGGSSSKNDLPIARTLSWFCTRMTICVAEDLHADLPDGSGC
jgi:hypothetical protein